MPASAAIGPAGENLVRAAMLVNDYNHTAAHGLGAVMGSKKLKAFVAWGTKRPRVHDKNRLIDAGVRWRKRSRRARRTVKKRLTSVGHGEAWGAITKLNWRSTIITDEAKGFDQNRVTLRPCFQCPRMCPWDVEIGEGQHKGKVGHFNAGSEWMDTFYNLGFKGNDVLYLSERINDLGIECSHFACGAGLAFEAWEKGVLGPDQTDGLKLEWGNMEAIETLLETLRPAREPGSAICSPTAPKSWPKRWAAKRRSGWCTPKAARRRSTSGGRCSAKCCASWSPAAA